MLIPFFGFIIGIIISSVVGVVFLVYHPKWKLSFFNLVLFDLGSILGAIILAKFYGKLFADTDGKINSPFEIVGLFIVLIVGVIVGGRITMWAGYKYLNK